MSIEVRRVPPFWIHPRAVLNGKLQYIPLKHQVHKAIKAWHDEHRFLQEAMFRARNQGQERVAQYLEQDIAQHQQDFPDGSVYMPEFPKELCTHIQVYCIDRLRQEQRQEARTHREREIKRLEQQITELRVDDATDF